MGHNIKGEVNRSCFEFVFVPFNRFIYMLTTTVVVSKVFTRPLQSTSSTLHADCRYLDGDDGTLTVTFGSSPHASASGRTERKLCQPCPSVRMVDLDQIHMSYGQFNATHRFLYAIHQDRIARLVGEAQHRWRLAFYRSPHLLYTRRIFMTNPIPTTRIRTA